MRKPQSLGVQNSILQQAVSSCARGQTYDLLGDWLGCTEKAKKLIKTIKINDEVATHAHVIRGTTVSMAIRPHLSSRAES